MPPFRRTTSSVIRELLEEAGLEYDIDKDGDFKLVAHWKNGRSQVLYIDSEAEEFEDQEIVTIWSPAHRVNVAQRGSLGMALLLDSGTRKIGAWEASQLDSFVYLIYYSVKVPLSSLTPDFLEAICHVVAEAADLLEKELSEDDRY